MNEVYLNHEISETKMALHAAELEVERIKRTYQKEEVLLNLYLPSAEHLVDQYKRVLIDLNQKLHTANENNNEEGFK